MRTIWLKFWKITAIRQSAAGAGLYPHWRQLGLHRGPAVGKHGSLDTTVLIAIAAMLLLIIFTGYLIIYNVFQISVTGDIRFYGLLKTIGTTPRQLRRIIR